MIKLRIRVPKQPDSVVSVPGDELTIGRSPECDVVIDEAYVSAWHAKLVCGLAVSDLESTNGVWVSGERQRGTFALDKERFRLGPASDTNPTIEVLEVRAKGSIDPALLHGLEQENETLRARVAELEAKVLELQGPRSDGPDGGGSTLMMPMPGKAEEAPPAEEPAEEPAEAAPAESPEPTADKQSETAFQAEPPAPSPAASDPAYGEFFTPTRKESPASQPMPAAVPAGLRTGDEGLIQMIDTLVREDVGDRPPVLEGPLEDFFTLESFRLLRQVEKVITRLAREFNQLYDMNTMLPDTGGNFRSFAASVLLSPEDKDQRQSLVDYLDDLRRWLGVTLAANRKAAQRMISELKSELSTAGLTREKGVPLWKRATGGEGGELWLRAQAHLKELDDELIEDRLDHFAKEFAIDIMES